MEEDANEEDPEIRGRLRELAQPLRFLDLRLRQGGGSWIPQGIKQTSDSNAKVAFKMILGSSLMFDDCF